MLNVAYRESLEMESLGGPRHASRAAIATDRAKPAQALFRRDCHQPHGGAKARKTLSRGLARPRCAGWHRARGCGRSPETVAQSRAADLARASQRRDDRRRAAARARLAFKTGVHV